MLDVFRLLAWLMRWVSVWMSARLSSVSRCRWPVWQCVRMCASFVCNAGTTVACGAGLDIYEIAILHYLTCYFRIIHIRYYIYGVAAELRTSNSCVNAGADHGVCLVGD